MKYAILNDTPGEPAVNEPHNDSPDDPRPAEAKFDIDVADWDAMLEQVNGDSSLLRIGPDRKTVVVHQLTDDEQRQRVIDERIHELKAIRERYEHGTFEHADREWRCDAISAAKLQALPEAIREGEIETPVRWSTVGGGYYDFETLEQARECKRALNRHVQQTYANYRKHKEALAKASDPATYDVTTKWQEAAP